ncbi:phosphatase PAP2 family protein [Mucilaginibacter sp.]|uniref:phosphatase PAP2 family protein n=1 Tax=Mucilaginibacter sp. TaxID=1882438 RepID=UPI003D0D1D5E
MKKLIVALFCIVSLGAQAQVTDTTTKKNLGDTIKKDLFTAPDSVKHLHSKAWTLVPPAALIGYGALSFAIHPLRRVDYYISGEIKKTDPNFDTRAESYFLFTPIVMVYGLNLIGVEGKNRFIDRTALLGLSGGLVGLSGLVTKKLTHRLRPNGKDYLSFPSGHTAAAFMGAEYLAQEYSDKSPVYTIVGYSFAVATGVFRMYNRDHWFSDVVAGAGLGILSTKTAYLIYPYLRNALTHTDKKGRSTMILPIYQNGAPGVSFAMNL